MPAEMEATTADPAGDAAAILVSIAGRRRKREEMRVATEERTKRGLDYIIKVEK